MTQHHSAASNSMFVTAYTPPRIDWRGPSHSTQPSMPAGLQTQGKLLSPPLVGRQVQKVFNSSSVPQEDSRTARQAQANPVPELQVRPSWLHGQRTQQADRGQAIFQSARDLPARFDARLESVHNLGTGSPRPIKKTSAPPAPSAEKTTAPLATLVKKVTAPVGPQGGKESPPLTPPPVPVTQEPASLSRSSSSSSSSQSFLPEDLLKALRNNRCVQNLKRRTTEHNSESKGGAATPPQQIMPKPVNGQRMADTVYLDLLAAVRTRVVPASAEYVGMGKVPTGSQESLNDSGLDSPPQSPNPPGSPVAMRPAGRDGRFGVWHSDGQWKVLAQLNKVLNPLGHDTTV